MHYYIFHIFLGIRKPKDFSFILSNLVCILIAYAVVHCLHWLGHPLLHIQSCLKWKRKICKTISSCIKILFLKSVIALIWNNAIILKKLTACLFTSKMNVKHFEKLNLAVLWHKSYVIVITSFSRNLSWNQFHEKCNWILTKQEPKRAHICNAQLILHLEKLASKLPGIWLNQNGGVESYQIHNWE